MLSSHSSPPVSTPLEPCRVAPYVNVPSSLRANSTSSGPTAFDRLNASGPRVFPPPFTAFDPALITAAHQVREN